MFQNSAKKASKIAVYELEQHIKRLEKLIAIKDQTISFLEEANAKSNADFSALVKTVKDL